MLPIKDFRKRWERACRKSGCPGALIHDFRRTAARNLIRNGVPETVAMQWTGHLTRAMLDRYNITDDRDLRAAARTMNSGVDLGLTENLALTGTEDA